jgi:transposase
VAHRALEELKKAETESRTVVFIDEAGFYMLPNSVRTYAPRGETPVMEGSASRDHVSAISAITPAGRLLTSMQEETLDWHDIVDFLRHLLRHIEGKVLVIQSGGLPAHRSQKVKDFLSETGGRVHLEQLPSCAPDLNPDEGVWRYLKNVELKNVCCEQMGELKRQLRLAFGRLRHKTDVITGCFGLAGLDL